MIAYVLNPIRRAKSKTTRSKKMARKRRRVSRRRPVRRRRRRNAVVARPRRRRRRARVSVARRRPRRRVRRRRNTALTAKAMYTNPRRRRIRRRRRANPIRRRASRTSYRRNPRFKFLPSMAQIKMSLWGGTGFLVNKIAGNAALYGMVRFVPGFNNLPGIAKAVATPLVGTALSSMLVNVAIPSKGRAYAQAGVNIALGYGLIQALLGSTGLAARIHPILGASLSGDDYVSSGALAGMGDWVNVPRLGDYVTAGLGESTLPGHYAETGIEPYVSSGSLLAGGGMGDFYYGV